jgi:hypothetical protein
MAKLVTVFCFVAVLTVTHQAFAQDYDVEYFRMSGEFCQPIYTDNNQAYRIYGGLGSNSSTNSLFAICPMKSFSNPPVQGFIWLTIGSSGSTNTFPCYMAAYTNAKTGWWGSPKYLCSTAGGCTSSTAAGANNTNYLFWQYPFGSSALSGLENVNFECSIPPGGQQAMIMEFSGTDIPYSP